MEYKYMAFALVGILLGAFLFIATHPPVPNRFTGGIMSDVDRKLLVAATIGNYDEAEKSIEDGADIHSCSDSALIYACANGYPKIVRLLLKNGANLHVSNDLVFRLAENQGHPEVTAVLNEYVASENPAKRE